MTAERGDGQEDGRRASGYIALPEGARLDGRYIVKSVLGAGGFGITYVAEHETLRVPYAIKENFPRQCAYRDGRGTRIHPTDPEIFRWAHERFLDEGRRLAKCRHPNIVGVTNVFEENGTAYMVLEYEEGQTLLSWLRTLGHPLTQAEIDALLIPILDALDYVHAQGLLHRDIAPDNIMIRRDGKPCLIDFGAAREAIAERSQAMSAVVKPGYSPIEQFSRDGRAQGPWSDIYALAATLSRAIHGTAPPEAADRAIDDRWRPLREVLPSPERYRASFLDGLDRALRVKQSERPQSIAEWRKLLFAEATPTSVAPAKTVAVIEPAAAADAVSSVVTPPSVSARPRPRVPLAAGILVVLAVAAIGALVVGRKPTGSARVENAAAVVIPPVAIARPPAVATGAAPPPASPPVAVSASPSPVPGPTATVGASIPKPELPPQPLPVSPATRVPPSSSPAAPAAPAAAVANAATAAPRRIEVGTCFSEFRSKAKARLPAADQSACAALCDARAGDCDAWEYLDGSAQPTNCALFSPAPSNTLPCSAARNGAKGAIGYRQ